MNRYSITTAFILFLVPLMASAQLEVTFTPDPMFSEVNFLPGDVVSGTAEVTNTSGAPQTILTDTINESDPDGLSAQFQLVIEDTDGELFNDTIGNFFAAGEVDLGLLANNGNETYTYTVTFFPSSGNEWQNKSLGFDICVGFEGGNTTCENFEPPEDTFTICHATESPVNPFVKLTASTQSFDGHFDNNGTPNSGHEDDLLFVGDVECPDVNPNTQSNGNNNGQGGGQGGSEESLVIESTQGINGENETSAPEGTFLSFVGSLFAQEDTSQATQDTTSSQTSVSNTPANQARVADDSSPDASREEVSREPNETAAVFNAGSDKSNLGIYSALALLLLLFIYVTYRRRKAI